MITLHTNDFNNVEGQRKIISLLHSLDARMRIIHSLLDTLSHRERYMERDVADMLRTESIEYKPP